MPKIYSTSQVEKGYSLIESEHTPEHPYCGDQQCWCHYNIAYHDQIQHPERNQTPEQVEQAYSFFGLFRR